MTRHALYLFCFLLVGTAQAQRNNLDERAARIEENTTVLKESLKKVDERLESAQKDLRALQDRVVAVDSQNKIIISIAAAAFTIGLGFLVWLGKKFEAASLQQQSFKEQDRLILQKIYEKLNERSASAGSHS